MEQADGAQEGHGAVVELVQEGAHEGPQPGAVVGAAMPVEPVLLAPAPAFLDRGGPRGGGRQGDQLEGQAEAAPLATGPPPPSGRPPPARAGRAWARGPAGPPAPAPASPPAPAATSRPPVRPYRLPSSPRISRAILPALNNHVHNGPVLGSLAGIVQFTTARRPPRQPGRLRFFAPSAALDLPVPA
jgi:hypothetical protein